MKNMGIGILLTVFGMGTTFIALWLVILSSKLLSRLFPFKEEAGEEEEEIGGTGEQIIEWSALEHKEISKSEVKDLGIREAILAAAVISYLQADEAEEKEAEGPHFMDKASSRSEFASSSWKMEGRRELFSSRRIPSSWKKR